MSYQKLGLKCGIEIHQQLEGKKLFCSCPTLLGNDLPHFTIQRQLRAAAGEEGTVDIAAQQEQQKQKTFVYEGYHDSTCLVETDSEPPHEVNNEALQTTLQFCKIVNATVPSVVQFMRKTVVDGSNTSGFQRTGLVGKDGLITTKNGPVRLTNISLEEDSCKIINDSPEKKVYRLDRLGIPLIEIGTAPDITSPEQCQEVAKQLGMLLRSLPSVKRGLGTIRQDINISILGGNRVEIKGAQDLRQIPLLVEYEVKRQEELLKLKDELKLRKIKLPAISDLDGQNLDGKSNFNDANYFRDVTSLFLGSTSKIIATALQKKNGKVLGMKLPGFAGLISRELAPNYRLGKEFSGRVKVIAGVGGTIHSDEYSRENPQRYDFTRELVLRLEKALDITEKDAYFLVADEETKARRALEAVYQRAAELFVGVPKEVRKVNDDATTSYLRPMPGAARMYPETDVPLIFSNLKTVEVPELLTEKIQRFQIKQGLGADLAEFVAKSDKVFLFEEMTKKYPQIKPAFIADVLVSFPLEIRRKYGLEPDTLTENQFREFFRALNQNQIHKDIVLDVLIDMIKGTYELSRYATMGTEEIHRVIKNVVEKNKDAPFSALMGMCMKQLAGKASGQFISEQLKKILEKGH